MDLRAIKPKQVHGKSVKKPLVVDETKALTLKQVKDWGISCQSRQSRRHYQDPKNDWTPLTKLEKFWLSFLMALLVLFFVLIVLIDVSVR